MRTLADALAKILLGGWADPPLRWKPERDLGLALLAVLFIVLVNALKLAVPAWRDQVDWLLLNCGVFWLVPLL